MTERAGHVYPDGWATLLVLVLAGTDDHAPSTRNQHGSVAVCRGNLGVVYCGVGLRVELGLGSPEANFEIAAGEAGFAGGAVGAGGAGGCSSSQLCSRLML